MQSVGPWVWTPGAAVYRRPADFGGREGRHPSPPLDAGAVQRRGHGRSTVQGRRSRSMVAQTFTAPMPRIDSRRLILVPITGAAVRIAMPHVSPCAVVPCRYSRAHGLIHTTIITVASPSDRPIQSRVWVSSPVSQSRRGNSSFATAAGRFAPKPPTSVKHVITL